MKLSESTIDAVRRVSVLDIATALGDNPKRSGTSYQVYCPNPAHSERTPDTYIKPSRNIWRCFGGGGCGAKGADAITYYAWHQFGGWDPKTHFVDAVVGVANQMGITVINEETGKTKSSSSFPASSSSVKPRVQSPAAFEEITAQDADTCDRVYRKFLQLCPIYREHAEEWLGPKRQYSKEQVLGIGLRSVPHNLEELFKIINKLHDDGESLVRIPGFTQRLKKGGNPENEKDWYWTISVHKGYLIPVRDDLGRIVRLRVATGGKPKYIWFSSQPTVYLNDGAWTFYDSKLQKDRGTSLHHMSKGGAPSGAPINVVVPPALLKLWESGTDITDLCKMDTIVVTEGEHKSNISSERLKMPVIGVPGVGNWKDVVALVNSWQSKKLAIAYDMDALKSEQKIEGKNQQVFDHLVDFAKELLQHGIDVVLWTWNIQDGKGLDDILLLGKLPIEIDLKTRERRAVVVA
ncbi:CHC2 zinc finger domain-containing protein [Paenibacillus aestuarii]|uniref:CHC2 zinc finger domain-containing protein n=1 Tax=Paenibacillus aestuarii TaxID=516965 RepID=A0ABW0K745_9BACL